MTELAEEASFAAWNPERPASSYARIVAWVLAARLDRKLAVGVPFSPGSALLVHADRITSVEHREALARALRLAVSDASNPTLTFLCPRVPVHQANVRSAEALIDAVTLRLHSPGQVTPRGMALLRLLLADGVGPLYDDGRGDLRGRLGAVLAAL